MKQILVYFFVGILVAIGGMFVSDLAGHFLNGLGSYGLGCVLGICLYLCVVVVTCTGIIITKNKEPRPDEKGDKQSE